MRVCGARGATACGPTGGARVDAAMFRFKAALQQAPANPHLQCGGAQQVTPAHDVVHAHVEIIDHHGQLVSEQPIGPANHAIAHFPGQVVSTRPVDAIGEGDGLLRHGDADGVTVAARQAGAHLLGMLAQQAAACARIHREAVSLVGRRRRADIRARTEAGIQHALRAQAFQRILVSFGALGLEHRLTIPVEPEPMQVVHHEPIGAGDHAGPVHVFDAHHHAFATGTGREPCAQHGVYVADVHAPRRRGGESSGHRSS